MAGYDPKKIQAAVEQAAKEGPDMREESAGGGGDYTPPAKGLARARFIGYIEVGEQEKVFEGKSTWKPFVWLIFELSGKKHPPREVDIDGETVKIPHRLTVKVPYSLNKKAHFFKIFAAMNHNGDATHVAQLLGESFLVTVHHFETKDGKTIATLKGDTGYSITAPYREDPESGELKKYEAEPQITETRCFLWDYADKEMWDSLYIPGEYSEGKSKNVFQDTIRGARNFPGSLAEELSHGAALNLDDEDPEEEEREEPEDEEAHEEEPAKPKPKAKRAPAKSAKSGKAAADPLEDI